MILIFTNNIFGFAGKLMSALLNGIHDRSNVVQKTFAFALGHLVRVSMCLIYIYVYTVMAD